MTTPQTQLFRLSLLALVMAAVVVVLGAYTRLVHAGLGCPDWPTCYGHFWVPNSAEEIHAANQSFADSPVETNKTWPEQIHRIFASGLGVVILVIFFVALKHRSFDQPAESVLVLLFALVGGTVMRIFVGDSIDVLLMIIALFYFGNLFRLALKNGGQSKGVPFKLPALLAGLVVLQGLFGMWTVTLKLWPQVVTAHLLGGFFTLSLLWLLVQRVGGFGWRLAATFSAASLRLRLLSMVALWLVVLQIALGGWTSSNYAALACLDFPLCHNQLFPPVDIAAGFNIFQHIGPNYLGGLLENNARTAIHVAHRFGALVVAVVLIWLAVRLIRLGVNQARNIGFLLLAGLGLQLILGVSNVVMSLPLAIAVAHNAGGALVLLLLVLINHRVRTVKTE